MSSRVVRVLFVLVVVALLTIALVDKGATLDREVRALSLPVVLAAFAAGVSGLVCSLLVWRSVLADLGSRLSIPDAWRVFFVGQLGKYIPGSVWPVLAQMELAAQRRVPRDRSAVSMLVSSAVMVVTGGLAAAVCVPLAAPGSAQRYLWALLVVPVGVVLLSPPLLNRMLRLILRILRRPPPSTEVSVRGLAESAGWATLGWILNGLMVYLLTGRYVGHGGRVLLVSVGAYALSWVAGYLAVFAPAGAGVRDAVMLAVLATQTKESVALSIALIIRALSVVADAVTGAIGAALIGRRQLRALRANRSAAVAGAESATTD